MLAGHHTPQTNPAKGIPPIPILQVKKLRLGVLRKLTQSHRTASVPPRPSRAPGNVGPFALFLVATEAQRPTLS